MFNDLVSVIIPTFNRAYCIRQTIDSVLSQTYPYIEVIIIDDGSTDFTDKVISQYYCLDRRVRYFYQNNKGVSASRNAGITLSRGRFIAFLDSDDLWEPWKLELQTSAIYFAPEAGMVWTDMDAIDSDGNIIYRNYLKKMYRAYSYFSYDDLFNKSFPIETFTSKNILCNKNAKLYIGAIFSNMIMGNLVHTSTTLIERSRLNKVGLFNENLKISGEDYDFHLRTCKEGPVAFINLSSTKYKIGEPDQLTRPSYRVHIARNFLNTIDPLIRNNRNIIKLSPSMISEVLAYANGWLGRELLLDGQNKLAMQYLLRSLSKKPLQFYNIIFLFLCFFNRKLIELLRHVKKYIFHSSMV